MINPDKIRLMTDLAIYRRKHDEDIFKVNNYYRSDYVFWNTLLSLLRYTFCFVSLMIIYMILRPDVYFYNINLSGVRAMFEDTIYKYIAGLVIYMVISIAVYSHRYKKARKGMLFYATKLRRLQKRYNTARRGSQR